MDPTVIPNMPYLRRSALAQALARAKNNHELDRLGLTGVFVLLDAVLGDMQAEINRLQFERGHSCARCDDDN